MNKIKEAGEWAVAILIFALVIGLVIAYGIYVVLALTFLMSVGGLAIIIDGFIEGGRGFSSLFQRSFATLKRERRWKDED
jgi:hypothetical protein